MGKFSKSHNQLSKEYYLLSESRICTDEPITRI